MKTDAGRLGSDRCGGLARADSVLGDRRVLRRAGASGSHDLWVEPAVGLISSKRRAAIRTADVKAETPAVRWVITADRVSDRGVLPLVRRVPATDGTALASSAGIAPIMCSQRSSDRSAHTISLADPTARPWRVPDIESTRF